MVTVVIIGILASVAMPLMTGDREEGEMRAFSASLARDFQRARNQAVVERLPVHAYVYNDRVEYRVARPGLAVGDPPILPLAADPALRVSNTKGGIRVWNVTTVNTPPGGPVLNTAVPVELQFTTLGGVQVIGAAQWAPAFVWIRDNDLPGQHPYRNARVEVTALTGFVRLRERW